MHPLGRYATRAAAVAVGAIVTAAVTAAMVRLLPWLLAAGVPLTVAIPFGQALGAVAVEVGLLAGLPIGFAMGAALLVDRGEARALMTLGASPWRLVGGCLPHAVLLGGLAFVALAACNVDARSPGRITAQLIEQGWSSCQHASHPHGALVPMVGVTWLCFPGQPPRVVGTVPATGQRAWFSASSLHPSPDLREFQLEDLRLVARRDGARPELRVHVKQAAFVGLSAWGRTAKLPTRPRAALVAAVAAALSLLVAGLVTASNVSSRVGAALIGAAPAVVAIRVLHRVDDTKVGLHGYVWVPVAAAAAALGCTLLWRTAARVLRARRPYVARYPGQ